MNFLKYILIIVEIILVLVLIFVPLQTVMIVLSVTLMVVIGVMIYVVSGVVTRSPNSVNESTFWSSLDCYGVDFNCDNLDCGDCDCDDVGDVLDIFSDCDCG